MRHIEDGSIGTQRTVLLSNAGGVLNGHVPAAKVHHLAAVGYMPVVQHGVLGRAAGWRPGKGRESRLGIGSHSCVLADEERLVGGDGCLWRVLDRLPR